MGMNVEMFGAETFAAADINPLRPHPRGTIEIARRLRGKHVLYEQPHAMAEATLATVGTQRRIVLRSGIEVRRANFLVGKMLARLLLESEIGFTALTPTEQDSVTRDAGAWFVAPTPAVQELRAHEGSNIGLMADTFVCSWTCAQMRDSETGGPESAIVTPTMVYKRGTGILSRLPDNDARELVTKRAPRSVRKVVMRDDPRRVALLPRAG